MLTHLLREIHIQKESPRFTHTFRVTTKSYLPIDLTFLEDYILDTIEIGIDMREAALKDAFTNNTVNIDDLVDSQSFSTQDYYDYLLLEYKLDNILSSTSYETLLAFTDAYDIQDYVDNIINSDTHSGYTYEELYDTINTLIDELELFTATVSLLNTHYGLLTTKIDGILTRFFIQGKADTIYVYTSGKSTASTLPYFLFNTDKTATVHWTKAWEDATFDSIYEKSTYLIYNLVWELNQIF